MEKSDNETHAIQRKKTKVAFFTDILTRDFDGAIKTMYQLIDRIPRAKFDYLFFCGTPPKQKPKYRCVKVPAVIIPFNVSYKAALPRFRRVKLTLALIKFKPDVIHISTPSSLGFFGLNYAKRNNIPVLSIYHTHFISYMRYYFAHVPFLIKCAESFILKRYLRFYNACDLIYVPTKQIMKELSDYGISEKRMKLWQRGINAKFFNPNRKDKDYIQRIAGNNKPSVLFASRIVWEKNLETLFGIYDEIQAQQLDVNFIVAGSGAAEEEAYERMPEALFLGFLSHEELGKLYASTDVFVFTSISESYGNVVVEAMACGCVPVIARGGGSQALVEDKKTGFLCEPNDPHDYIEKVKLLIGDHALKEKMQAAGYAYTSKLSWENLANTYFEDIELLAQQENTTKTS